MDFSMSLVYKKTIQLTEYVVRLLYPKGCHRVATASTQCPSVSRASVEKRNYICTEFAFSLFLHCCWRARRRLCRTGLLFLLHDDALHWLIPRFLSTRSKMCFSDPAYNNQSEFIDSDDTNIWSKVIYLSTPELK